MCIRDRIEAFILGKIPRLNILKEAFSPPEKLFKIVATAVVEAFDSNKGENVLISIYGSGIKLPILTNVSKPIVKKKRCRKEGVFLLRNCKFMENLNK